MVRLRPLPLSILVSALAACGKEDGPPAASKPESGVISGRLTVDGGRPIGVPGASATVSIEGVAAKSGERVQYAAAVNADGTYRQKVVEGAYRVQRASVVVEHEGRTWTFHDLEPVPLVRGDRDAAAGIVQDFIWKQRGPRPGSAGDVNSHTHWYGAPVCLNWAGYREDLKKAASAPPPGTTFTFTLTSKGTRVDGAPGETLVVERTWDTRRGLDVLNDIPRATYDLTGVATLPDGAKEPLLFEVSYAKYAATLPVKFTPGAVGGPIHAFGFANPR